MNSKELSVIAVVFAVLGPVLALHNYIDGDTAGALMGFWLMLMIALVIQFSSEKQARRQSMSRRLYQGAL